MRLTNIEYLKEQFVRSIFSLRDYNEDEQEKLIDSIIQTYRLRHDILHYIMIDSLTGSTDYKEKEIKNYYPYLNEKITKLTPDIFIPYTHILNDNCFYTKTHEPMPISDFKDAGNPKSNTLLLIDISVSTDPIEQRRKKQDKYSNIVEALKEIGIGCDMFVFNVNARYDNLSNKLMELEELIRTRTSNEDYFIDFPTNDFMDLESYLTNTRDYIRSLIKSPAAIEQTMMAEFGVKKNTKFTKYSKH